MNILTLLVIMKHNEEHYYNVKDVVIQNECKYNAEPENDDIEYNENGPPEHLWAGIAPNNENSRLNTMQENVETITSITQDDINDNTALITNVSSQSCILQRYESASNHNVIPPNEYRQ